MKKILSLLLTFLICTSIAEAKDLRFVQISDTRYESNGNNQALQNIIADINKQKNIEFVIFTGDNINKPSEYELKSFLNEIKELKHPYYVIVGDKDVNKLKHLSKVEYAKILKKNIKGYKYDSFNYSFKNNGVIFVVADGAKDVIPGPSGYYKDNVLTWLDSELTKYPKNNVIILQHFPVIPPSKRESYYTFRAEDYLKIVSKYQNVKAIISGHFGVNNEQTVNGIQHISTAGVPYYRIIDVLDCNKNNPTIWAQIKQASN